VGPNNAGRSRVARRAHLGGHVIDLGLVHNVARIRM
jgi:hypothetical protein